MICVHGPVSETRCPGERVHFLDVQFRHARTFVPYRNPTGGSIQSEEPCPQGRWWNDRGSVQEHAVGVHSSRTLPTPQLRADEQLLSRMVE